MIWYQNQTNTVDFTLTESTKIPTYTPFYLFHLYSPTSHENIFFSSINISTNITRYDRFEITLTGDPTYQNLSAGTIYISPNGKWDLYVYQMFDVNNLSLDNVWTGGTNPIETGWVKISGGTSQNFITKTFTGGSQYYNYYQPNL